MKFFEYNATNAWLTATDIFVELKDGRKASLPIKNFPLLNKVSATERENFEIINGYALHWPLLGEDLSIAGFFEKENTSKTYNQLLLQPSSMCTCSMPSSSYLSPIILKPSDS